MKRIITKLAIATIVVLFGNTLSTKAQAPTPTTSDVQFVCSGGLLNLGTPPSNTQWIVKYAATTADLSTPTSITPTSNQITGADVKTGYYLITSRSTATGACESDIQTIPVFVFDPILASITAADYCTENAATTTISGVVTSTAPAGSSFTYQWYAAIDGGAEAALPGETSATLTPTSITNNTNVSKSVALRLRVGYMVGTDKYCGTDFTKTINVLPKPTTPTITIGTAAQTW